MIYAFDDMSLEWAQRHDHDDPTSKQLQPPDGGYDNARFNAISLTQQQSNWSNASLVEQEEPNSYPISTISLPESTSPTTSELGSLPLPHLDPLHHTMDIIPSISDPHADSSWKEYTQLWRQVVEDSSLFEFGAFSSSSSNVQGLGLDAEPTPPLDLETVSPVEHFAPEPSTGHPQHQYPQQHQHQLVTGTGTVPTSDVVELVAPKPRRLVNPAIHLAALVELEDDNSVDTASDLTADETVQEVVQVEDVQQQLMEAVPVTMYDGAGEMVLMMQMEEECEPARFDMDCSSLPPSSAEPSSAISFDGWMFPPPTAHHQEAAYHQHASFEPLPVETISSPLHVNPTWQPRTSQLREAMRERRVARHVQHTHSRHASLPDVQYRPVKWNTPMLPEAVYHRMAPPVHRRDRDASRSVDWSAIPQQMVLLPPADDYSYHLTAPQYAAMPFYGNQPFHLPYGRQ